MKSLIVIAIALSSVATFAAAKAKPSKEAMKAAKEACKEVKDKKEHKACMKEKLAAAPAMEAAPAAAK